MSNHEDEKVKMRLLLESWGLADTASHLEANDVVMECLPGLDDGMIAELFPSVGKRLKFRTCLREYLETCDMPVVAEVSETSDRNETFQVLDSSELRLPDDMFGEYVMENQPYIQEPTEDPLQDPILLPLALKLNINAKERKTKGVLSFPAPLPELSPFLEHHRAQGTLKSQRKVFIKECCNHLIVLTNGHPTSRDYLIYSCSIIQKYREFRDENSLHPAESLQHSLSHMVRNRRMQARKKRVNRRPGVLGFKSTSGQSDNAFTSNVLQSELPSSIKDDKNNTPTHKTKNNIRKPAPVALEQLISKPYTYQNMHLLPNTLSTPKTSLPDPPAKSANRASSPKMPRPESSIPINESEEISIHNAMKKSEQMVRVELDKSQSYATATTQTPARPSEDSDIKKILETVTLLLAGHQETKIFIEMQLKKIQEQADLIDELRKENEQLKQKQNELVRKKRKYR